MLWRTGEHEGLTDRRWDERVARDAIETIVSDAEAAQSDGRWPGHPLDGLSESEHFYSLYLGSGGMVWALSKLPSSLDAPTAAARALERYRAAPHPEEAVHPPSLLMGEAGLLVVAAKVGSPATDPARLEALVRGNREHPTWELLWGSPGTMLAARACDLAGAYADSAGPLWASWDEGSGLWTQHLYGHVKQYLGPAHGFAGNAHALRGAVGEEVVRERVRGPLDRAALHQDGLVNWPPSIDAAASEIRVQWCHGAPGIIATLGDLLPEKLVLGGGELTWRAGPLRKGPGLCHGTAGNGFAFLRLHELTGDDRWLDRARRFAMHAIEQVKRQRTATGRGRYTLWTGDIGVALYLQACLDGSAAFPMIDGF